jgi:hypothetical protein
LAFLYKRGQTIHREEIVELDLVDKEEQTKEREVSIQILKKFITEIAQGLNSFCANHLQDLKKTLIVKTSQHKKKTQHVMGYKPSPHEIKN